MYTKDVESNTTSKRVMMINFIRGLIYFLVVGVQVVHCTTGEVTCSVMIVLVPLFLGLMDVLFVWMSKRDTIGVRFVAVALSLISMGIAIYTVAPIIAGPGLITIYLIFMFYLSWSVIGLSIIEFVVVALDLSESKEQLDEARLPGSVRTY